MHKNVKYILTTAVSWRMICPHDKSIFERGISNDYFIQNTYRLWLEANLHDAPYQRGEERRNYATPKEKDYSSEQEA